MIRFLAAIGVALLAVPALAHGGDYKGGAGSGGGKGYQVPPDVAERRRGPTTWETWWSAEKARYLHLSDRVRVLEDGVVTGTGGMSATERRVQREVMVRDRLVPLFIAALSDSDAEIRSSAAIALGKTTDPRGLAPLAKTLKTDSDDDVRASAVIGLGLLGRDLCIPYLDDVLVDHRDNVRRRGFAAMAMGLVGGDDAAAGLVRFCTERVQLWNAGSKEKERLVAAAFVGLGLADSEVGLTLLRDTATNATASVPLRGHALLALGRLQDHDATPAVARILGDGGTRALLRRAAAIALGDLVRVDDEKTLGVLIHAAGEDPDFLVRHYATLALGERRSERVRKFLRNRFDTAPDVDKPFVALALGLQSDVESVPRLRKALKGDKHAGRRSSYCLALGLLGDKASTRLVMSEVDNPSTPSRAKRLAILSLALMDAQQAKDPLFRILKETDDPVLRVNVATSLALLGDVRAREFLIAMLDGMRPVRDRAGAAVTLGVLRIVEAAPKLIELFEDQDTDPTVRAFALVGLGFLADPSPTPKLSRLSSHGGHLFPLEPLQELLTIL